MTLFHVTSIAHDLAFPAALSGCEPCFKRGLVTAINEDIWLAIPSVMEPMPPHPPRTESRQHNY
jgi:hypothetical protein